MVNAWMKWKEYFQNELHFDGQRMNEMKSKLMLWVH